MSDTGNILSPFGESVFLHQQEEDGLEHISQATADHVNTSLLDTQGNRFSLTEAEKISIETDIIAGKPIMATHAYLKLLSVLLPSGLKIAKGKKLYFSDHIPEYEVQGKYIYMNHAGATTAIKGLSILLGRPLRFPTKEEFSLRILEHHHYGGYRSSYDGELNDTDVVGYGWILFPTEGHDALYAYCNRKGLSASEWSKSRAGLSVFPSFE